MSAKKVKKRKSVSSAKSASKVTAKTRAKSPRNAKELAKRRSVAAKKAAATRKRNARAAELAAKKRSRAAKKGWETRRKRAAKRTVPTARKKPSRVAPKKPSRVSRIRELEAELERLKYVNSFVDYIPLEWLREDMTLAKFPSRLRHLEYTGELRAFLKAAEKRGDLSERAKELAERLDTPIREVYTLFFSP